MVASVCLSVCLSVRLSVNALPPKPFLSTANFGRTAAVIRGSALPSAAKGKEESLSVRGVCVWNSRADAVDWLLIIVENLDRQLRQMLPNIISPLTARCM